MGRYKEYFNGEVKSFTVWHSDEVVIKTKNKDMFRDKEFQTLLLVNGIFTVALIVCDFIGKWSSMAFLLAALIVLVHLFAAFAWYKSIKHFNEFRKDYWRKITCAALIAGILLVMGHRAGYIENQMFEQTVEENKAK